MSLQTRPPIITIMGHVDHGKTTLLDYIRKSRLQKKEVGGITQHIGAYQIKFEEKKITFIDTPGHSAFNKMRQRGAQLTDIVILVVAANDGVQPQTIESIKYIKESEVPFIVAINKMDLPDANPDMIKSQLAQYDVLVHEYGGEVDVVPVSAQTGKGVDKLLGNILIMAELLELKADPEAPLEAVVIESAKDQHKGAVNNVIVQQGTLKVKQELCSDGNEGRVKLLTDENGQRLEEVLPGDPAELIGLEKVCEIGSVIRAKNRKYEGEAPSCKRIEQSQILSDEDEKKQLTELSIEDLMDNQEKIKLIIKADVHGTLEAIMQNLDEDTIDLLEHGVGQITEQDLELAHASEAVIISFSTKIPRRIKKLAKEMEVRIKEYDLIYDLIENLESQMLELMEPTINEVQTGKAEILQIFDMNGEKIAGIRVITGEIKRNDLLHLERNDEIIGNPVIKSMKHGKDDILVVKSKHEAGLTFKNSNLDFKVGDYLIAYKKES